MFFGERRNWDFLEGPWVHFHRENIWEITKPQNFENCTLDECVI